MSVLFVIIALWFLVMAVATGVVIAKGIPFLVALFKLSSEGKESDYQIIMEAERKAADSMGADPLVASDYDEVWY